MSYLNLLFLSIVRLSLQRGLAKKIKGKCIGIIVFYKHNENPNFSGVDMHSLISFSVTVAIAIFLVEIQ